MSDAKTELHAAIMNIPCKPYDGTDAYTHYCRGHRDARHAAAELALALRDQPPSVPQGWRPIESAPKDGTLVLLWLRAPYSTVDKLRWEPSVAGWVSEHWEAQDEGFCGSLVPSHWQPLPPAPDATPSAPSSSQQGEADAAPVPVMAEPMRSVWIEGKEQEAFEAWVAEQLAPARYNHPFMVKTASGTYSHPWMADRWEAWSERAKRASLESAKSGEVGNG